MNTSDFPDPPPGRYQTHPAVVVLLLLSMLAVMVLGAMVLNSRERRSPSQENVKEELYAASQPDAADAGRIVPVKHPGILGDQELLEARLVLLARGNDGWVVAIAIENISDKTVDATVSVAVDGQSFTLANRYSESSIWHALPDLAPGQHTTVVGSLEPEKPIGSLPRVDVTIESIR